MGRCEERFDAIEVERAKLVPLRDDDQRVGAVDAGVGVLGVRRRSPAPRGPASCLPDRRRAPWRRHPAAP